MNNEDANKATATFETDETLLDSATTRRQWHKPPVTRIEIKRTLGGAGSSPDGADTTT